MLRNFYFRIIIQTLLIAATMAAFFWAINKSNLLVTSINLLIICILQIVFLIWFLNRTNRDLERFFEAFKFHDSTITFNDGNSKVFTQLYSSMNKVLENFNQIRKEREKEQFFYLNAIHHVNIGMLAIDPEGNILLCNKAIVRLFRKGTLKHISQLDEIKNDLSKIVMLMTSNQKEFVRIYVSEELIHLSLRCTEIKIENKPIKLISFQDIKYEIEQDEIDAWQRLLRTLNHEIMNSVSPITLTTSGIINLFEKEGQLIKSSEITDEIIENTVTGLQAIRKRSKGLTKFVESYRSISQIPQPVFSNFEIVTLFENLKHLLSAEFEKSRIQTSWNILPDSLQITADEKLIEQVLLNLIKNSIQALSGIEKPEIIISAWKYDESVMIAVKDNGVGIAAENLSNIFMPFFSTKPEGSGIGLSLSRQIVRLHSGSITVRSIPNTETIFTIKL